MAPAPAVGLRPVRCTMPTAFPSLASTHPCGPASTSYSRPLAGPTSRPCRPHCTGPSRPRDVSSLAGRSTGAAASHSFTTAARPSGSCGDPPPLPRSCTACPAATSGTTASPAQPPPASEDLAWSEADIRSLGQGKEELEEAVMGQEWRSQFADDPTLLYDYVDEAHAAWEEQLQEVLKMSHQERKESGAVARLTQFPGGMGSDMVGMGSWRLKGAVDGLIEFMVARIEGSWRELLDEDLTLYPKASWKDRGWDFVDSLDPTNEWDQYAYVDVPDPEEGDEEYPRLQLENRIYCSRVFRKLHIEVGWQQDGLDVLHVVLYPRYEFDLPILAMDLVARKGAITLAVIDACPVRPHQQLPPHYMQTMLDLQKTFMPDLPRQRKMPAWGNKIFSPLVVCLTPETPEQLSGFVKYAVALHRAHLQLSHLVQPVDIVDRRSQTRRTELLEGHASFVKHHLENKLTRRVLDAAFGEAWADDYMRNLLFDFNPTDDPPWVNGELNKLYDYFDYFPEIGTAADEIKDARSALDSVKADKIFAQVKSGYAHKVSRPQVEWALQHQFDSDEAFRSSIQDLVPNALQLWEAGQLGKMLAAQLPGLAESRSAWTRNEDEVKLAAMEQKGKKE